MFPALYELDFHEAVVNLFTLITKNREIIFIIAYIVVASIYLPTLIRLTFTIVYELFDIDYDDNSDL